MTPKRPAATYLRAAMIALALFLPALSLIPLGSLWLWEKGYLLYWVAAALALSVSSFLFELWLVRRASVPPADLVALPSPANSDAAWTPREAKAWSAVESLAGATDPALLTSREAVLDLGLRTIETVARSIHPDEKDPLWRFTVPEALALVEKVSRDLRPFVADNIPLGDQLTVAQVLKIYRWRSAVDVASQAYDLWRIVRLLNPVAAVTTEAREQLTRKLYTGVRDELAARLTRGYVREVGRAAIDLYGGRLRVSSEVLAAHVSDETVRDRAAPEIAEPLRILVAGQISAGKSSLINALAKDVRAAVDVLPATRGFTAYTLTADNLTAVTMIDSPGVTADAAALRNLAAEAAACDLILWVAAANRADRETDRAALDAIRSYFASHPDRRPPPILAALTHIDRLRPSQDWQPPYDIASPATAKAISIRAAMDHVSGDLGLAIGTIIPVCLADARPAYNVELVWAELSEALPEAKRAQLIRRLRGASGWTWSKLWSQAVNAGRVTARSLTK
jgi:uncharacterized protein